VRLAGGSELGAAEIASGTIRSGEINPMFYSSLGWSKANLAAALG
jgi:hypothetical protein